MLGNYGRAAGMTQRTEEAVDTVWEFAAFLLTALLFLLIGLLIALPDLVDNAGAHRVGHHRRVGRSRTRRIPDHGRTQPSWRGPDHRQGLPLGWLHIMMAAGLRGAVAVALALSLPADLPQRQLLVEIVFGIILFTLIAQGLSLDTRRASQPAARRRAHARLTPPGGPPATVARTRHKSASGPVLMGLSRPLDRQYHRTTGGSCSAFPRAGRGRAA